MYAYVGLNCFKNLCLVSGVPHFYFRTTPLGTQLGGVVQFSSYAVNKSLHDQIYRQLKEFWNKPTSGASCRGFFAADSSAWQVPATGTECSISIAFTRANCNHIITLFTYTGFIANSKYKIQALFKDVQGPKLHFLSTKIIDKKPYPRRGHSNFRLQCDTEVYCTALTNTVMIKASDRLQAKSGTTLLNISSIWDQTLV